MKAGARFNLISFYRDGAPVDDGYTTTLGEPTEIGRAYAEVRFGTGQERREAAQESASVPATFVMLDNPITRSLTTRDKIRFQATDWDISSSIPGVERGEWQVTATRAA